MKYIYLTLFVLLSLSISAQSKRHHSTIHKPKVVSDKQYEQKIDSTDFEAEFFVGNMNAWNGENYGHYPSLQFFLAYNNNKNYNIGLFGCINYNGFNTSVNLCNGVDAFFSRKLSKKTTFIFDVYAFLDNRDSLSETFSYTAKTYRLSTARIQYDFNKKASAILGYSVMNDHDSLEQSMSLEFNYDITKYLNAVFVYSTGSNLLKLKEGSFNAGIGFTGTFKKRLTLGIIFSPLYYYNLPPNYTPLMFVLSTNIKKQIRQKDFDGYYEN